MPKVFWSWQSDAPFRETRQIIKEALEEAVSLINADVDEPERADDELTVDHDTKGISGSPDIVNAILQKIDGAHAFVADVTPIGVIERNVSRRHVANPNVLIELGYAKKALGLERIIQVWNTAITECSVADLPFDMRGRRGPISFYLPVGASTAGYRSAKTDLSSRLQKAIALVPSSNESNDAAANWPAWHPHSAGNPATWFNDGAKLTVNESSHGSGKKVFPAGPTRYVRLLPKAWQRARDVPHTSLLGHVSGISWGRVSGGLLTYQGSIVRPELADSPNGTMLFFDTGEIWAIDRMIVSEWRGKQMIDGDDMFGSVVSFLSRQISMMVDLDAEYPMRLRLGASGILESYWPLANPIYGEPQALESEVEVEGEIYDGSREAIEPLIVDYWTALRDAYGMPPPDAGRIEKAMQFMRT